MSDEKADPFQWVTADEGIRRRVLASSPDAMSVEFEFQKGAVGQAHSHPHLQVTYVAAGRFEFVIDDEIHDVSAGDSVIIPRNAVHSCTAFENGTLIDTFTPRRVDFL